MNIHLLLFTVNNLLFAWFQTKDSFNIASF